MRTDENIATMLKRECGLLVIGGLSARYRRSFQIGVTEGLQDTFQRRSALLAIILLAARRVCEIGALTRGVSWLLAELTQKFNTFIFRIAHLLRNL